MNHIQSPRTDDAGIEAEIQAKGKTAPRITPQTIENAIASEHYFTAAEGDIYHQIGEEVRAGGQAETTPETDDALHLLTFCVLVMHNGFTVTGESACASPENFDAEIGRKVARENAKQKLWPLLGYQLKEQLLQATQPTQSPV